MDIEKEIRKILWGKSIVSVLDGSLEERTYILRSLTIAEQNELDFVHEKSLNLAFSSNILSKEELEYFYLQNEIWTEEDDKEVAKLKKEIKKLIGLRSKIKASKVRQRALTRKIDSLSKDLEKIENYNIELFSISAERYAEEVMNRHMIYLSATKEDGSQLWANEDAYLDSTDEELIFNLTIKYINNNLNTEKNLRKIARSGSWRYRWSASKNGESLFGKPISEWTQVQNSLVYWSQYYDYVFESMDRPDARTIEDDATLDRWVEDQNKEAKRSSVGSKKGLKISGKSSEFLEEFIMVDNNDTETIQEIYNENTTMSRQIIKETKEKIDKEGTVKDWHVKKDFRKGRQ